MSDAEGGGFDLNLNSKTVARQVAGEPVGAAIDAALLAAQAKVTPRDYLGASYIGGECERAIQYTFAGAPKDPGRGFPPHILRIFERGHIMEDMMLAWLRQAGFVVAATNAAGYQFGFLSAGGRFKGHADGVITSWAGEGEAPVALPALWEAKALNAKNFAKVKREGLKKAKPAYYAQVQLYQHYLDLTANPCVFTVLSADTMEIHTELVPFDPAECQRMIDRAARIISATDAGELLPRGSADRTHFMCMFCDFPERCWSIG